MRRLTDRERRELEDLIRKFEGRGRLENRTKEQSARDVRFYRLQLQSDDDARSRDANRGRWKTGHRPIK
jgi:hypothetical protein